MLLNKNKKNNVYPCKPQFMPLGVGRLVKMYVYSVSDKPEYPAVRSGYTYSRGYKHKLVRSVDAKKKKKHVDLRENDLKSLNFENNLTNG